MLSAYRGIEGVPWPNRLPQLTLVEGLVPVEQLSTVLMYLRQKSLTAECELLYIERVESVGVRTPASFVEIGFDVGVYTCEDNCYSAVFHELLFGKYDELAEFAPGLNEHLLFSTEHAAERFRAKREDLLAKGFDLEEDDEFSVFRVATSTSSQVVGR